MFLWAPCSSVDIFIADLPLGSRFFCFCLLKKSIHAACGSLWIRPYSKSFRPPGMTFLKPQCRCQQVDWNTPFALSRSKGIHMLSICHHRASNCLCCSTFCFLLFSHSDSLADCGSMCWMSRGWGMESSSSLPLPHFIQASGIHCVAARLLDSVVASRLGRGGRRKVAAGYLHMVGV